MKTNGEYRYSPDVITGGSQYEEAITFFEGNEIYGGQ
jgi:hypothetical protein